MEGILTRLYEEVEEECGRQNKKWGPLVRNRIARSPVDGIAVVAEEFGESAQAVLQAAEDDSATQYTKAQLYQTRHELIQLAASTLQMIRCIDAGYYAGDGE